MSLEPDSLENADFFGDPEYLMHAWANCALCEKPIKGERALRWEANVFCGLTCLEQMQELHHRDLGKYLDFPFESYFSVAPAEKACDYCGGPLPKPGEDRYLRIRDKVPPGQAHTLSLAFCGMHCCGSYEYEESLKDKYAS